MVKIRLQYQDQFDRELIAKGKELSPLFKYVNKLREERNKLHKMFKDEKIVSSKEFLVDYSQLIQKLPSNVKFTEDDLSTDQIF